MTDPTPYTDDDVDRLAEWAHLPGVTNVSEDRQVALNLLRRGVTLPPEPDTPPEPQERYYVEQREVNRHLVLTGDRVKERLVAECFISADAELIARCLNLDAMYEDGIEAEVGQLRLRADAFQAKFEEQCQQGDDMFISHYKAIKRAVTAEAELERLQDKASARAVKAAELALEDARAELIREREDRGLERDLFAARVKELEAERLGATTNQPVTAEMVYGAVDAAGVRDGLDRGDGPAYIRPCDWTSGEALAVADALNRLLAERLPAAAPQDDGPAELLFTGGVRRVIAPGNSGRSPLRVVVPASAEEALKPGDLVDVYPHAQRPTDTPTTNQPGDATWQIGQVEAWGWHPAMSAAPADCTGMCGDGECNCSGEYRVLSWAPPGDGR